EAGTGHPQSRPAARGRGRQIPARRPEPERGARPPRRARRPHLPGRVPPRRGLLPRRRRRESEGRFRPAPARAAETRTVVAPPPDTSLEYTTLLAQSVGAHDFPSPSMGEG